MLLLFVLAPELPSPHAIKKALNEIATAERRTAKSRLRRTVNGVPSRSVARENAPQLCQGKHGWRLPAFAVVEVIVSREVPFPPLLRMTGGALAEMLATAPLLAVMLVAKETVPA